MRARDERRSSITTDPERGMHRRGRRRRDEHPPPRLAQSREGCRRPVFCGRARVRAVRTVNRHPEGLLHPVGLATLACLLLSLGAIGSFYSYARSRPTELTARVPDELRAAAEALRNLPGDGVLVLPFMYADYVA